MLHFVSHLYMGCGKAKGKTAPFSSILSLLLFSSLSLFCPKGLRVCCWTTRSWCSFSWNAKIGWNLDLGCVCFVEKLRSFYSIWGFFLWETAMPALVNYRGESSEAWILSCWLLVFLRLIFGILVVFFKTGLFSMIFFVVFLWWIVNMVNAFCSCVLDLVLLD